MRLFLVSTVISLLAWPGLAAAMVPDEARHLLVRTGFDASPQAISALASECYEAAVDRLLANVQTQALTAAPEWIDELPPAPRERKQMSESERKAHQQQQRQWGLELKQWWYREMITTDSPLTERMTLFWANHFTSSMRKVRWMPLMYEQNVLLRKHALGNFRAMLHDILRDPAMLIYLDNARNRVNRSNENLARELLELFTLGEGRYSEQDIKEAARALTGYTINRRTGRFRFARRAHDDGSKTFLGQTGAFNGDDLIDIILRQPAVAEHITTKLWREFISLDPDPAGVRQLARVFRDHDYDIRALMRVLLLSDAFRDRQHRGGLIKSPVELLVGTVRVFDVPLDDLRPLVVAGRRLGQDVFSPPNVKGWPGGRAWIDANTLLLRQQLLRRITRGKEMKRRGGMLLTRMDRNAGIVADWQHALLPLPPANSIPEDAQHLVANFLLDPVYQLK